MSARGGKIVDVGRYRIGQHERQLGAGGFDFGLRLRLDVGVHRRRDLVGFVDRGGLGFLRGRRSVRLQGRQFRAVHALQDALQLMLHALIGANFGRALQQLIYCAIKTAFGSFQIACLEFFFRRQIFLFGAGNQIGHRISGWPEPPESRPVRLPKFGEGRRGWDKLRSVSLARRHASLRLVAVARRAG